MLLALIALLACGGAPSPAPESGAEAPAPEGGAEAPAAEATGPALVVWVVVDQLPIRALERLQPSLTGGLARLTGPDAWHGVAAYSHAITNTCPGHATISTGAPPSVHGIVNNGWIAGEDDVYCGDIVHLKAEPLADRVTGAGGTVVSLSHKDRGAIMLGGHDAAAVVHYDREEGAFTGADWAAAVDLAPLRSAPWEPLNPELYATFGPDEDPGEGSPDERTAFPHDIANPGAFLFSAAAGAALVDVALAALEAEPLGAEGPPDLLTLSFSNTDYVGHAYTAESWEAMDTLLVLDLELGRLLDHLDQRLGRDAYTVVLTSDHGVAPDDVARVDPEAVRAAAGAALAELGIEGEIRDSEPYLVLPAIDDETRRAEAASAVAEAVSAVEGIAGAWAWRADGIPDDAPHAEAIRASLHPDVSGDIYVLLDEGVLFTYGGESKGSNHGTPYDYDRRVPLLLYGAGVAPGVGEGDVDVRQVAPTIAKLLRVDPPAQATEPPVSAALR